MEGDFRPGTVLLEKYRVEGELGRGGMGVVLRVTHLHLGEELAIKVLSPKAGGGPEMHARFLREARSAVQLRGEHIARVGDVGELPGGAPYIVMEYLRGGDLSGELARRGALPPGEVVDYVLHACEALAEAHALGIVHRDIKPGNLFLTRRPDRSPLVKVLDFGISKTPVSGPGVLTRTDAVLGTPGYMSPEQMMASKDVDARSDVWALGIVLYECLNGRRPFDAETFSATVLRAATEPPPPMHPRIPRGLQAVVLRCLEKDRAARFPSTAALAASLAPFARDARSAEIVVERTTAMLQGLDLSAATTVRFGQAPDPTTLSSSVGMMRARATRRYAIGGVALAVSVIAASIVVARTMSGAGEEGTEESGSPTAAIAPTTAAPEVATTSTVDAAVALPVLETIAVAPAVVDASAKARQCAQLEADQRWMDLRDCGSQLMALDGADPSVRAGAEKFRMKADKEIANALVANKLTNALNQGNLREAQTQLTLIESDSAYSAAAKDAFRAAEVHAVDVNRLRAQALVAKKDCAGVRRLQAQVDATGTPVVADAVAAVAANCHPATR